jgi:hypothetical protein
MALVLMRMPWNRVPASASGAAGGSCQPGGVAAPGGAGGCAVGGSGPQAPSR